MAEIFQNRYNAFMNTGPSLMLSKIGQNPLSLDLKIETPSMFIDKRNFDAFGSKRFTQGSSRIDFVPKYMNSPGCIFSIFKLFENGGVR